MFINRGMPGVIRILRTAFYLIGIFSFGCVPAMASSEGVIMLRASYAQHTAECGVDCKSHFTPEEIAVIEAEFHRLESLHFLPESPVGVALGLTDVWYLGRELISRCNALLVKREKKLHIVPGDATCFAYKKATDEYVMEINLTQLRRSRVGCILPAREESERTRHARVYPVGADDNPGFIVLGHELCHALHFMDFNGAFPHHPSASRCGEAFMGKDGPGSRTAYEKRRAAVDSTLWPNALPKRDPFIWKDSEEQVTVLGMPLPGYCVPQLSEFFLRLAAGRLPRYAYQRAESCFFEDAETVERLMYTLLGERWMDILRSLPHAKDARFDDAVALDSPYSPWYTPPSGGGVALVMDGDEALKITPQKAAAMEAKRKALAEKMAARSPASGKKEKKDGSSS